MLAISCGMYALAIAVIAWNPETYEVQKKGLLNAVNTEYKQKVINRLDELAKELGSEFDSKSPNPSRNTDVAEIHYLSGR
ncbi:MAG: hypothetical protein K8S15_02380 [Candidatus Aegiribacteria sp.]|nr:hypothetical protein [Candidatus Aegiribacteria sp.]